MDPHKNQNPMKDLTIENITENVKSVNEVRDNPRLSYLMERLVSHLHDFARETRLSTKEWMAGIDYLTAVGQKCSSVRQEFILLSDILGLSLLVDSIDHPKPPQSTEGSLLGPFHSHEAEAMQNGDSVSHDSKGEPCLVLASVKNSQGQPIPGVKIDVWETDSSGHYDLQNDQLQGPDGRAVLKSDPDGCFWFKAIVPVSYPIPDDGPVGHLLALLGRHPWRPAHMHFMFEKVGYDHLITALYVRGDPYETSDVVFGVKDSLLVNFSPASDAIASQYGVKVGAPVLKHDFVLVSEAEASKLRADRSVKALHDLGRKVKIVDGLPVPDVD